MAVNRVPISIWHVRPSRSNLPAIGRRRRGAGLRCRVPRYWMITSGIYDSRCTAAILSRSCPLWVKSRHSRRFARCPLYPQKRTSPQRKRMSALCQKRTLSESLAGRLRQPRRPTANGDRTQMRVFPRTVVRCQFQSEHANNALSTDLIGRCERGTIPRYLVERLPFVTLPWR